MDYYEQLQRAIFSNNLATVKHILTQDTEDILSIRDKVNGSSMLHYAAYCGSPDIVTYLLDQGAEKDAKNDKGETSVHIACARKNSEALDSLIHMDADTFPLTNSKWSPLHCCVFYNSIECIESLPLNALQINFQDVNGLTALHIACANGNHYLVNWLLRHQADPEIPDNLGRLPVHIACSVGSQGILCELVKRGADLSKTDLRDRTVFHYACRSAQKQAISWELVRYLTENTLVSPWTEDRDGAYPVMHALIIHKVKLARQMLNLVAGRSQYAYFKLFLFAVSIVPSSSFFNHIRKNLPSEILGMADENGFTALHYAAEFDRDDRVTALISMGFDVDARARNGVTPLHCAAMHGHKYVVEILLENQVEINDVNDCGQNALHLAILTPHSEICIMFVKSEIDIFAKDAEGRTALMYLCNTSNETPELLQLLLCFLNAHAEKMEDSKYLNMKDNYGWTALHFASSRGNSKMVLELIKRGADVCSTDNNGRNAAHLAVQSGKSALEVISVLRIRTDSIFFQRDNSGFLAVHYAATRNDAQVVVEMLERQKSKVLPQSGLPFQLTPLHLAAIYGRTEVAKAIIGFYQEQVKSDNYEECLRSLGSLKINEEDGQVSQDKKNYDPLAAEDNMRRLPLHYAMKYGFNDLLSILMPKERCSILLGWQDCDGVTPLMMASANAQDNCIKETLNLLDSTSSIVAVRKQTDSIKRSAAMFATTASGHSYKSVVSPDNFAQMDRNKRGLIHRAAFSKKNDLLRDILKECPSQVNQPDINGVTPLHLACFSGNLVGIQLLLKAGALLSAVDNDESTPGDWAVARGYVDAAAFLLKHYKANLKLTTFAICKASEHGFSGCVELLVESFPEMVRCYDRDHKTPLHLAAENGHKAICQLLVDNGAFMDAIDNEGCTPLMLGAKCKNGVESVAYLVRDADCPLTTADVDGNTALHLACLHDNPLSAMKIFEALINREELSLVTSQRNIRQETLLHLAVKMNSCTMIETLMKHMKTDLWERDSNGRIPLVCMVDNPAIICNMRLLLMELVSQGKSLKLDLNDSVLTQSELDGSSHNSSFNSTSSSGKSYEQGEFESY